MNIKKIFLLIILIAALVSCRKEVPEKVVTNTSPIADFSISPRSGNTDTLYTFDGSASRDREDTITQLKFRWKFISHIIDYEDNVLDSIVVHKSFTSQSFYNIQLIVADKEGLADTVVKEINVSKAEHYPDLPRNPYPENNSEEQDVNLTLDWSCSHPDNDYLHYNIFFGKDEDPEDIEFYWSVSKYTIRSWLDFDSKYYWKIEATDESGNSTMGPVWSFATRSAIVPGIPGDPSPSDNSTDQELILDLSWSCSNPDRVSIHYDIYFGEDELRVERENWSSQSHRLHNLDFDKTYQWKIVARDGLGNILNGPVWRFATKTDVCALYWQVCQGTGLSEAADYPGEESLHPIMICGTELEIPETWRAGSVYETELVACVQRYFVTVETCSYTNGGTFTRYRRMCSIDLHEAKTGDLVKNVILQGGEPDACPPTISGVMESAYGTIVSDLRIIEWLRQYVED